MKASSFFFLWVGSNAEYDRGIEKLAITKQIKTIIDSVLSFLFIVWEDFTRIPRGFVYNFSFHSLISVDITLLAFPFCLHLLLCLLLLLFYVWNEWMLFKWLVEELELNVRESAVKFVDLTIAIVWTFGEKHFKFTKFSYKRLYLLFLCIQIPAIWKGKVRNISGRVQFFFYRILIRKFSIQISVSIWPPDYAPHSNQNFQAPQCKKTQS
jgi:hypothetical protein